MSPTIAVAYIPLSDSLPLLVARDRGYFAQENLTVCLRPLRSWAQVRDALMVGEVQAAHCLAGIPLAAQAGLFGRRVPLATALTLNHFGNAITLSRRLCDEFDAGTRSFGAALRHSALRRRDSVRPLTLASVFPISKHEFELRHWLRGHGLDPDYDVNLVVVPPPLVDRALQAGQIHGFCVGEPWNSLAQHSGSGKIVATSQSLGLPGTEKVLAVHANWLQDPAHHALIRALLAACRWLAQVENQTAAANCLGREIGVDPALLAPDLAAPRPVFSLINCPDLSHASWLLQQMRSSGLQLPAAELSDIAARAFRPDVHREVLAAATSH